MKDIRPSLKACTLCKDRFANTVTGHRPNPVVWFEPGARILIAGQAPGMRVHKSNIPFSDPSGTRLRDWLGLNEKTFYDKSRIAIMPMAFCFPGYDSKGSDLPPPPICAATWRADALAMLPDVALTIIIGGYAMKYHLGTRSPVTEAVRAQKGRENGIYTLPHPSWRNTGWIKKNPWFDAEILPSLRQKVTEVLNER